MIAGLIGWLVLTSAGVVRQNPVDLLAAEAPGLAATMDIARAKAYVVLDGTLIAIDQVGIRTKSDRPYYSESTSGTG